MILIRPCIPVFMWDTGTTYITLESDDCCFAVSHIVTHYYAASHWVPWSVSLSVALSVCQPCKAAETIKLPFAFRTRMGPINYILNEVQMPTWEWAILRENRQTVVKYRDTLQSSLQRRLNWSRCRLVVDSYGPKASCVTWEVQIPHGKGQLWRIGAPIVKYRHFLP